MTTKTNETKKIEEIKVDETKKGTVTVKTLKAWTEQCRRIIENEFLGNEKTVELYGIMNEVQEAWMKKNF